MVKSQRCGNIIFTTSFLQRCYVISQCCVHVVAQHCGLLCSNVAGMLFSQRCKITLYNVVLTLCVCWVTSNSKLNGDGLSPIVLFECSA